MIDSQTDNNEEMDVSNLDEVLDFSIVENPGANKVDTDPVDEESNEEVLNVSMTSIGDSSSGPMDSIYKGFDPNDYTEYLGRNIFMPSGGVESLNLDRANNQSFAEQAGSFLMQTAVGEIFGGTVEAAGYLLDFEGMANLITGNEKEYTNWLSDIGKKIREQTQESFEIYETNPGEMNFLDSGYWFKNGVSVASTLSMMFPALAGAKAARFLGRSISKIAAKGIKRGNKMLGKEIAEEAVDLSKNMSIRAEWATDGVTQAVISRHIENSMESSGTFEEVYSTRLQEVNPKTGELFTEDEARLSASQAASDNYRHGWLMLAQDMVQYMGIGKIFNPATKQMESAYKLATKSGKMKKAVGIATTFASEGAEEGYQHYIASRASLRSDLRAGLISKEEYDEEMSGVMSTDEAMTSMLFGGLGGSLFKAVGPKVNDLFKSKTRKEREEMASQMYESGLEARGKMYASLNIEKNKAESNDDVEQRQYQMDNIMIEMVIDGIENDRLEMVMEEIKNGPEMSKEELKAFEEKNGYKWEQALAKEGAEKALKVAKEIKEIHYKNLNKASNKNVDSHIVKAITANEYRGKLFSEMFDRSSKRNNETIENIKYDKINPPTQGFKDLMSINSQITALEKLVSLYEKTNKKETKQLKDDKAILVKSHIKNIKALKEKKEKFLKSEEYTKRDNSSNDSAAKDTYELSMPDVVGGYILSNEINDAIHTNNRKLKRLNDKVFQKKKKQQNQIEVINKSDNLDDLKSAREYIENEKDSNVINESEKKELLSAIEKREKELKKEEEALEVKRKQDQIEKEAKEELDKKNQDKTIPDNNGAAIVEEILEDPFSNEEIDHEGKDQDEDSIKLEIHVNAGKSISLFDGHDSENKKMSDISSKVYDDWINNTKDKIGTEIRYEYAKRGNHKGYKNKNTEEAKAVAAFNEAKDKGTEIPESVYKYYPLIAFVGEGNAAWVRFPNYRQAKNEETKKMFYENYYGERVKIINSLYNGVIPTTKIAHTAGGQLVTEVDENGSPKKNRIRDLKQIGEKGKIELNYSTSDGTINEINKKEKSKHFRGKVLSAGKDEKGNSIPYSGGLFLVLNKMDGTKFLTRLNLLEHTKDQADIIAEILVDVAVPPKRKPPTKNYEYKTPLRIILKKNPELAERMKEAMPNELKQLESGSVKDLLDLFVHISDSTKGNRTGLYMSGVNLYFGEKSEEIKPENRKEKLAELSKFLVENKKRQFSINMWNDTSKFPWYRDFAIDNKLINTDVVTGDQNEFQKGKYIDSEGNEKTRYVKAFAAPLPLSEEVNKKEEKTIDSTNDLKKPVQQGAADLVKEKEGVSEAEIRAAIKQKFPNNTYHLSLEEGKDLSGKEIPDKDLKDINEIRSELLNNQPTQETSDTEIINNNKESVSSENNKTLLDQPAEYAVEKGVLRRSGRLDANAKKAAESNNYTETEDEKGGHPGTNCRGKRKKDKKAL